MQIDLLKEVASSVAGPNAIKLVDLLYNKKDVNEFIIANKLKLTINQTRNILYKLADGGIVSFTKKKDKKKGGWYTYFWTINLGKSLSKFRDSLTRQINDLKEQLANKQKGRFYYCPLCKAEFNEEDALLNNYTCPECGELMQLKEMSEEISGIEREISKFEKILSEVDIEVQSIEAKEGKARVRVEKAEAKKKKKERDKARKIKAKLKKKLGEVKKNKVKKKKTKKEKVKRKKTKKKSKRKRK